MEWTNLITAGIAIIAIPITTYLTIKIRRNVQYKKINVYYRMGFWKWDKIIDEASSLLLKKINKKDFELEKKPVITIVNIDEVIVDHMTYDSKNKYFIIFSKNKVMNYTEVYFIDKKSLNKIIKINSE